MAKVERNIKVGQSFDTEHGGKAFKLTVVDHDGTMAFKVVDAKGKNFRNAEKEIAPGVYRSVSSAAGAVMGPGNVNGWKFWGIDPAEAPSKGEGKAAAPKAKGTAKAAPKAEAPKTKGKAKAKAEAKPAKGKGKAKAPVAVLDDEDDEDSEDEEMEFEDEEDEDDE